jgi:hypothetical protein
MFYVYEFVIPSIEIISSIIIVVSMIIIIIVVVVMIIIVIVIVMFQVNLGPICLSNLSNVSQKIIYKQSINKL